MDVTLDATARDWQGRAFKFATEELIPWEVEAELHEGRLPPEVEKKHKKLANMRVLQRGNRLSITPVDPAEWDYITERLMK